MAPVRTQAAAPVARTAASAGRAANGRQGAHVAEMQRRRLLQAFLEVAAERGLEEASVGRVCKRAGMSRRTFYELFDDREECLLAAFDDAVERIAPRVLAAYGAPGGWCERIRGGLRELLGQLDAEPEIARVCVVETLKAGPLVLERRARVLAALVAGVEQGRGEARCGGQPPPLTGQGVVGGALAVVHERLLANPLTAEQGAGSSTSNGATRPFLGELAGSLMAMIVHPYIGASAARRELNLPGTGGRPASVAESVRDPFRDLSIRFTYRTARVLTAIASHPGVSNRHIAEYSGITDEGQMSRLLARLQHSGLIENGLESHGRGEPNRWTLTPRGQAVQNTLAGR